MLSHDNNFVIIVIYYNFIISVEIILEFELITKNDFINIWLAFEEHSMTAYSSKNKLTISALPHLLATWRGVTECYNR